MECTDIGISIWNQYACSYFFMLDIWYLAWGKTGISWMMIPFFFIGALAGSTNIYKMARKLMKK